MKQSAAAAALTYVPEDEVLGVGTGSTVNYFIDALAARKAAHRGRGLQFRAAPPRACEPHGIEVLDLNTAGDLDAVRRRRRRVPIRS